MQRALGAYRGTGAGRGHGRMHAAYLAAGCSLFLSTCFCWANQSADRMVDRVPWPLACGESSFWGRPCLFSFFIPCLLAVAATQTRSISGPAIRHAAACFMISNNYFSTFTQHDDDTWYSKFTDQHHINFKHKTVHIYMQVHRSPNSHASSHTKVHGYMQVHTQSRVQIHRYMRITGWTSSFCFLCSLHG